jgi:hypothetical protein
MIVGVVPHEDSILSPVLVFAVKVITKLGNEQTKSDRVRLTHIHGIVELTLI